MTHYKSEAKSASSAKMKRMGLHKEHKTPTFDGFHSWDGEPGLDSGNAGKMPITKSKFKRGGKVAHVEGNKAKHHLGKKPRSHKDGGGAVPLPHPGQRREPVPLPPRRSMVDEFEAENPYEMPDLGTSRSTNARGGMIGATPSQRKKIVGALVSRKKKEGMSTAIPKGFGVPRDIKAPIGALSPMKKGGRAHHRHEDEAEDRALIRKEVKSSALKHRSHKYGGGPITSQNPMMNMGAQGQAYNPLHMGMNPGANSGDFMKYIQSMRNNPQPNFGSGMGGRLVPPGGGGPELAPPVLPQNSTYGQYGHPGGGPELASPVLPPNSLFSQYGHPGGGPEVAPPQVPGMGNQGSTLVGTQQLPGAMGGSSAPQPISYFSGGPSSPTPINGGFNSPSYNTYNMPRQTGGRVQRATGGRTKAGKTNVNIIISPQSGQGQQPLGAGVGMGQPPVPPMMPPMPPQGMPPQGMPPQGMPPMPPGGGGGPFKKGGRVGMPKYQETEYGSGSGLGRLEKRKWPKANGTP